VYAIFAWFLKEKSLAEEGVLLFDLKDPENLIEA
jgi:hypothetical protein